MPTISAREMVSIIPTPLGFTLWDMFKQGWYHVPDPVSSLSSCFLRMVDASYCASVHFWEYRVV